MNVDQLTKIGLTRSESLVYLSLVKRGMSKTGEILNNSGLNSGKIYEILESLKQKGLVSESTINNIKHFSPAHPKRLYDYLDKKEQEIQEEKKIVKELIPQLSSFPLHDISVRANTYIGMEGLKTVVDELLDATPAGAKILTMGITGHKDERLNRFWKHQFMSKIQEKKIRLKYIFAEENTEYLNSIKKNSEVRTAPFHAMVPISIYGKDKVLIANYDEPITNIAIYSEKIAQSFTEVFNNIWKRAKK